MRPVILAGDIHGQFDVLHDFNLSGCDVIQVGDFGLGFESFESDMAQMEALNKFGKQKDINYFAIRGNHELPNFWLDSETNQKFNQRFSNITLLPDYYTKVMNGKRILFVGGGISIDRTFRVEGKSYWPDEKVQPPRFNIGWHDILISHTCPSYFPVVINHKGDIVDMFSKKDPNLIQDLLDERKLMNQILHQTQPKEWFFGHFHVSKSGFDEGVKWRCLKINEFYELKF